jgi:monovalent cation:H+ antiporter-2, CPA2 family
MGIVTDLIYIVLAALVGGLVAQAVRQPLLLGYILAGVIVGPYTAGPTVERIHDIEKLAEIGVALLLFTLGLEFSFGELRRLVRITFVGTPIQIILCIVSSYLIAASLGYSTSDSLWIGATISLSSTMVVLKTLAARDALETDTGRVMLAILIAQDVAVIPLILILPQLAGESRDYALIATAALKSAIFLCGMYFAGTRILPWAFARVSRLGSRELSFLATLSIALGAGFVSYQLGLSFPLGAFVAGMLLSETDFSHQALSDVSGLRDLFGLIFFVSVGMLFDPQYFVENLGEVGVFTGGVIAAKALIIGGSIYLFGYGAATSVGAGMGLSQVGEFAFVIASVGSRSGQLSQESYSLMISVAVVSMVATPGLFWIGRRLTPARPKEEIGAGGAHGSRYLADHVVILGGGVVGQYLARVLAALHRPYVVVEADYKTVTRMRDRQTSVIFGDATHRSILESAAVPKARLVVITTTNDRILNTLLTELRALNKSIPIVVRVAEVDDIEEFSSHDVAEFVQPQLEVGMEMVRQSLLALGISEAEIFGTLAQLRAEGYQRVGLTDEVRDERPLSASRLLKFSWFEVEAGSGLAGRSLREHAFRDDFGVSVAAVIRGQEFEPNPAPDFVIQKGDLVGLLGTDAQLTAFAERKRER